MHGHVRDFLRSRILSKVLFVRHFLRVKCRRPGLIPQPRPEVDLRPLTRFLVAAVFSLTYFLGCHGRQIRQKHHRYNLERALEIQKVRQHAAAKEENDDSIGR